MNVIVICSDTFRYDHLGFLKQMPVHTPNIDALAAQSASFADFRVCSFPTLVNRMDVFSGRPTFPFYGWGKLPREMPVLSEHLGRHGIHSALLADNVHLMEESFGFGRGFDTVKNIPGQAADEFQPEGSPEIELPCPADKLSLPPARLSRFRRNQYWYEQRGTNTTEVLFRAAIDWLAKPPEKFFLWIDAFDPHEPWTAPAQFRKFYPWDDSATGVVWPKQGFADKLYSPAELANIISLYRAEVSQIDHWVGNLLNSRNLDDTAVLFLSDHGFYFGEHNLLAKPTYRRIQRPTPIYEELGHIPLLLRHPGKLGAGQTLRGLAQPQDLFPTVTELLGVPAAPWVQGHSLVPRLHGESGKQRFAVAGCHPHEQDGVGSLTIWKDEWCLVHAPGGGQELFQNNTLVDNPGMAKELAGMLAGWMDSLGVPAGRQRQLMENASFGPWQVAKYNLWRRKQYRLHSNKGWV